MMSMSWVRRPSRVVDKYISLATSSTSSTSEDIRCESKQRYHDDSSSSSDRSNGDEGDDNNDSGSITLLLQQYKERRGLRRMRRSITVVLVVGLLAGVAALVIIRGKEAKRRLQTQHEDLFITKNVIINESIPKCTDCQPYSALPEWVLPLQSYESFDAKSMNKWISTGKIDKERRRVIDMSKYDILDGIIFWVNGSDPRHKAARYHFSQNTSKVDSRPRYSQLPPHKHNKRNEILDAIQGLQNTDNRFREQNELLYSLRSASKSLKPHLGTLHVISTDYWANELNEIEGKQDRLFQGRRGQLPSWLNTTSKQVAFGNEPFSRGAEGEGEEERGGIRFHHDWETFAPLIKTKEDINQWKMRRLPSFNSIAAEAVLGVNLPTLGEYSFLASDDMFLGQKLSTADFITPLYGPVLHLDMHHMIKPSNKPWALGEMAGLQYSIHLLKRRFGTRHFPYPLHVHKTLSKPLLIESRMMWKQEFEDASAQRFRGSGLMANSHMLLHGMTVERHREALLWSFFVAKIDTDGNGVLDTEEKEKAFQLMGITDGIITGRMRNRISTSSKSIKKNLNAVSFPNPLSSQYLFSSLDGYALSISSSKFKDETGILLRNGPPRFASSKKDSSKQSMRFSTDYCTVSMSVCWPQKLGNDTASLFTHFAFQVPSCGDCLIIHLVEQSGSGGLDAFLPSIIHDGIVRPSSKVPPSVPAHLPLGDDWSTLNFSLSSIASINHDEWTSRRAFCVALLQRYNYVIASASAKFEQVRSPSSARLSFQRLLKSKPAFICINDDIRSGRLEKVVTLMQNFFQSMWPDESTRLPYELQ